MSGISTGVGLISGINTGALISQLVAANSGPKNLAQAQVTTYQNQQQAYQGLATALQALQAAGQAFRLSKVFQSATTSSSNNSILSATASAGAVSGSYTFVVGQVASAQQQLSQGFTDRSTTALGLTSVYVEPSAARLDSDTALSQLNGGNGIQRGSIQVTDAGGNSATIDLSQAATVNDVLNAFNNNTSIHVKASVNDGQFVIQDTSGGTGTLQIGSAGGSNTAQSLGIAGSAVGGTLTGTIVNTIGANTSLQSLNGGNGIRINESAGTGPNSTPDFSVTTADGSSFLVDIGYNYDSTGKVTQAPVSTVGQLQAAISAQTNNKVSLQINSSGSGFTLVDNTTGSGAFTVTDNSQSHAATDLGIAGTGTGGTIAGTTVLAGLNSVLTSSLNAGAGLSDGTFNITARNGSTFNFSVDTGDSVSDILSGISKQTNGAITASLNPNGNGLVLTDNTGGTGSLIVGGAGATALGVATSNTGVAASSVSGTRVARQYITGSTLLSSLNSGNGIGTGTFSVTGPTGSTFSVNITSNQTNIGDVINQINSAGTQAGVIAKLDSSGSGIVIQAATPSTTGQPISVTDTTGTVAKSLNLAGTAASATSNFIDGSFRRTITVLPSDTLDNVVSKINAAQAGVSASVISDGSAVTPYRLQLTSTQSGEAGRVIVDASGTTSLNLATIADGNDARIFVGSSNPAKALLISRPTNSISGVIDNVTINLTGTSASTTGTTPVTLTVSQDTSAIETAVNAFITTFNAVTNQVNTATSYDPTTQQAGVLFGDGTTNQIESDLTNAILQPAQGVSGQYTNLAQVGITIGNNAQLSLNTQQFEAALNTNPTAVANLFSAYTQTAAPTSVPITGIPGATVQNTAAPTFTALGLGDIIANIATKYSDPNTGILTNLNTSLNTQIDYQNQRIAGFNTQLTAYQTQLQNQFNAMEQALASLQSQQTAITNLSSLTG